jgi:putative SOS response-associated peptidase YedK
MCFYYSIVKTNTTSLVINKVVSEKQLELIDNHYFANGFRFPVMPVIADISPEKINLFKWGLVPSNIRTELDAEKFVRTYNTLNARGENIFSGRLFGDPIKKRRCLVLSSGFFEWTHYQPSGKNRLQKYPFYITMKDEGMFVFGGIWDTFSDSTTGEKISTYSIVTTEANDLMSVIHNSKKRMPLILGPEKALEWLNHDASESSVERMIKPFDPQRMKAHSIQKINLLYPDNDNNPSITTQFDYPELNDIIKGELIN